MFFIILILFCLYDLSVLCHDYSYEQSYDNETNLTKITYRFLVNKENINRRLLNHFWENYKWLKTDENLVVSVGDCHTTTNIDWSNMLADVIYHWNNIPERQDGTGKKYIPTNISFIKSFCEDGMIQSYNDNYGDNNWYGLNEIFITNDGYITYSISKVNQYYSLNTREWQHVLCHEIGHGVGIGHQSEDGGDLNTCMDYDWYHSNKYPNKHDVDILDVLYGDRKNANGPHVDNKIDPVFLIYIVFGVICICFLLTGLSILLFIKIYWPS